MIVQLSSKLVLCIIHFVQLIFYNDTVRRRAPFVHRELCVWSVQAMEAEASYKACIQAANSAREQLDQVKVALSIVATHLHHSIIDHLQSGVAYNFGHVCMSVCLYVCFSVCLSDCLSDDNFRKP